MLLLGLLVASSLVMFGVCWVLSSPTSGLSDTVRLCAGVLAYFLVVRTVATVHFGPAVLIVAAVCAAVGATGVRGRVLGDVADAWKGARFFVYLLCLVTMVAAVFLFIPIATFLTSPGELEIHSDYLLEVSLQRGMAGVYAAVALYALAPSSRMKTGLTLAAMGAMCVVALYAFVLPFGYPMMTGLRFEQSPMKPLTRALQVVVDVVALCVVSIALRWVVRRASARQMLVGTALVGVSLVVATAYAMSSDRPGGVEVDARAEASVERPLRFARDRPNVLIVMLDRFMGGFVESILIDEPQLRDRLQGFQWFPRTVSAGENSIAGIHPILGGYDYLPVEMNARGAQLRDLSVEAFSILPINFSRRGYAVNVVNPAGLGFTMAGDCGFLEMDGVSCTHVSQRAVKAIADRMGFPLQDISEASYADLLTLLASMRAAPYLLKEVVLAKGPWRPFLDHSAGTTFRVWAELKSFPDLVFAESDRSNLNIIFNILPHEPYFLGEDCQPRRERYVVSEEMFKGRGHASLFSLQHYIAARCSLLMTADFLDSLKDRGVYDSTKVIIVSDHGIVGDVEDLSSRAVAGGTQANPFVRTRSVLLVKDMGATGPLSTSEDFLPNAEVPRIACEQIGGCVNPYLGQRSIEAHGREDPFVASIVPWQFNLQQPDAFVIRAQLVLHGKDPYDRNGWELAR